MIRNTIYISIFTLVTFAFAGAKQIPARIAGLETDSVYMDLLQEDYSLSSKEDSILVVVDSIRRVANSQQLSNDMREEILSFEKELFDLRIRKASIVDQINIIEQRWVLNNIDISTSAPKESAPEVEDVVLDPDEANAIYKSRLVKQNLSPVDFQNLERSEALEVQISEVIDTYMINYQNLISLKSSYESTSSRDEAMEITSKFDSLQTCNRDISKSIGEKWNFIYDNKLFAYGILMEKEGFNELLSIEEGLMRKAQEQASLLEERGGDSNISRYMTQKEAMVDYELQVAKKLNLTNASDSLNLLYGKLLAIDTSEPMSELTLKERFFIDYEDVEFSPKSIYASASAIPQTVMYDRGVIYRILVGNFKYQQQPSIFRGTSPLSYARNEDNYWSYYIGGFATREEADQAQIKLKERGFRRPEVVVWTDGEFRNISAEPVPEVVGYRVIIENSTILSDSVKLAIEEHATKCVISKVGADKFIIAPFEEEAQATSFIELLKSKEPNMELSVAEIMGVKDDEK